MENTRQINNTGKIKNSSKRGSKNGDKDQGFIGWFTQHDAFVIFGGFGIIMVIVIILTGIFQAGPIVRSNTLYNAVGALCMAFGFIYAIFVFMGEEIIILGETVDIGMVIYIAIVLFVMFVMGNWVIR